MFIKQIIITIFISILIGLGLFLLLKKDSPTQNPLIDQGTNSSQNIPTPIPSPTPLGRESNLNQEIETLEPKNFNEEFNILKTELK